ncbi:uncharacterized protein TRIVIDRAFT_66593 [Trichoderma virens Gv29-8]|uniref:F-box domain-containing protein n=1 Tax=Hypocrea virens (strain Gv29-8 / FGSC 10586) TaxID=413071 RepID=G9N6C8_HYPVG|nr:uncharacterized protein TRIVIDRAFT_66593 [Trichoderma virens Gv29-8]EHK17690.1 hypothetical protein TRIVIDRAFT_66593 [Trichoderma virens Gv29-8]
MANTAVTTPYILHYIFLHLPQQDLLLIQRVCRTWHEVISSSKVLQAALFLYPEPAKSVHSDGSFELNPLLKSRFSLFFDIDSGEHGLDPWFDSNWVKHMNLGPGREPGLNKYPKLDPRRRAAYDYPKASWRRMIPCMPPAIELQVSFECLRIEGPKLDMLRSLRFSNEIQPDKGPSALQESADSELQQPWLAFGRLYDIVEAAWFQCTPGTRSAVRFDYSFREAPLDVGKLGSIPGDSPQSRQEEMKTMSRYSRRERLRYLFPAKKIGGPGRIFVIIVVVLFLRFPDSYSV